MTKGFLTAAWKDAQATAKKQSQKRTKPRKPRKPQPPAPRCDLCGRRITGKVTGPYKYTQWCKRCLQTHPIYPTICEGCDGYHFPPGITDISDPMHIAQIAQIDKDRLERDNRQHEYEPEPW